MDIVSVRKSLFIMQYLWTPPLIYLYLQLLPVAGVIQCKDFSLSRQTQETFTNHCPFSISCSSCTVLCKTHQQQIGPQVRPSPCVVRIQPTLIYLSEYCNHWYLSRTYLFLFGFENQFAYLKFRNCEYTGT